MPIIDLFSARERRRAKLGSPVLYHYDRIPDEFRNQVVHIWRDSIGDPGATRHYVAQGAVLDSWKFIQNAISRELGLPYLGHPLSSPDQQCIQFLLKADVPSALDLLELTFRYIDRVNRRLSDDVRDNRGISQEADDAIKELNHRFLQHDLGYQYSNGMIIRIDSLYIHAEAVEPALALLNQEGFAGPENEFLQAHKHYRSGRRKESIVAAENAFESTIKVIYERKRWRYDPKAAANKLIQVIIDNKLIPSYLQDYFNHLIALLTGLPTVRNKAGGHGQGSTVVDVPDYVAAYAIHSAATSIVFLMEAYRASR